MNSISRRLATGIVAVVTALATVGGSPALQARAFAIHHDPADPLLGPALDPVTRQGWFAGTPPDTDFPVTIPVPVYRQTMNLDCETAALQMALASLGRYDSQAYLFSFESPDTRPAVLDPAGSILQWGDPYTNFVGNVNGHEYNTTGYGVYWPVILSIAHSHGAPGAVGQEGFSAQTVYGAIAAGHPVEVWVEYGWDRPQTGTWRAWDGRGVRYGRHEHTVVLSGVSATQVRVNDPWPGSQYWLDKSTFETSWSDFNNMAIIFE